MNEILSQFLMSTILSLENVRENGPVSEFCFDINCTDLKDYLNNDILKAEEHSDLFKRLCEMKGPVLYWFEILSDNTNDSIIASLRGYKRLRTIGQYLILKNLMTGIPEFYMLENVSEISMGGLFSI